MLKNAVLECMSGRLLKEAKGIVTLLIRNLKTAYRKNILLY